jgi:hypothetical protein
MNLQTSANFKSWLSFFKRPAKIPGVKNDPEPGPSHQPRLNQLSDSIEEHRIESKKSKVKMFNQN